MQAGGAPNDSHIIRHAQRRGSLMRVLRLDPRPPDVASVAEAAPDDDGASLVDATWESAEWAPVPGAAPAMAPSLAFVDGVQHVDRRFTADDLDDGDRRPRGWPIGGVLASYAAGAMCPGEPEPLRHVRVCRAAILGKGARPDAVVVRSTSMSVTYTPAPAPSDDPVGLDAALNRMRSDLEAEVVRRLLDDGAGLVVVDGRLPPDMHGNAVGLIKTPRLVPLGDEAHVRVVVALRGGERSPVFVRQRSDRHYYSWFVCLRTPGPRDLALSGVALMEMDGAASRDDVLRTADLTAALLPVYAPAPHRDPRAPQNLLPVGQLERALRHRLGDRAFMSRLLVEAFARQEYQWTS
jgi:hypothetical protein